MLLRFCIILSFCFICVLTVTAQNDVCNLELKFFEYNLENSKLSVNDIDLTFVNLKDNKKEKVKTDSDKLFLPMQSNGQYKVVINKEGFSERTKAFNLDCKFVDKNNSFVVNIYLKNKNNDSIKDKFPKVKVGDGFKTSDESEDSKAASNNSKQHITPAEDIDIVTVKIVIDVDGNVISAEALDGKESLIDRTLLLARRSKFAPTFLSSVPVEVSGNVIYRYKK